MANFWVDIENGSGERMGAGPLRASYFRVTPKLSQSGEFGFGVSPADPNFDALAEKLVAVCRYADGTEFGSGIIDSIKAEIDEHGVLSFVVSGNTIDRELTYRTVEDLKLSDDNGNGIEYGPDLIMDYAPSGWDLGGEYGGVVYVERDGFSGWRHVDAITQNDVYVGFDNETVLNALSRVGEHISEHWRLDANRTITWLGPVSSFASSGLRAVQHVNDPELAEAINEVCVISNMNELRDASGVVTRLIPRGSGNGSVIADLAHATDSPPAGFTLDAANNVLINTVAEATYGRIDKAVDFKELGPLSNTTADIQNAANMILQASVAYLERHAEASKYYEIELANVNQILQVGTTLRVIYRKVIHGNVVFDVDEVLNIVAVTRELDEHGAKTVSVQVSSTDRLAMSDEEYLANQIQEARVLATRKQLGPSLVVIPWQDEMDDGSPASLPFWLGAYYTSVNRALLRFRVRPLRSTVKSVAGQSTTTAAGGATTSSGGGAVSTTTGSGGGGWSTTDSTPHSHTIAIAAGSEDKSLGISFLGSQFRSNDLGYTTYVSTTSSGSHNHSVYVPNHTHGFSIGNHTHTIGNHTHTLTPNITMVHGIYEESSANTLEIDDITIHVNYGSDLSANVVDLGNDWYGLDIGDEIVDSTFRPTNENNIVTFETSETKSARIEAQLEIRGAIQAVDFS